MPMRNVDYIKGEEWRLVPGYDGRYSISSFRRIKRNKRAVTYKQRGVECQTVLNEKLIGTREGRLIWACLIDSKGHATFQSNLRLYELVFMNVKDALSREYPNIGNKKKIKCLDTGVIYNSIQEAARTHKIQRNGIQNCLRGKAYTCGGLRWKEIKVEKK